MGRLFWKIFLGFWIVQIAIGAAVGAAVYLHNQARMREITDVAGGPQVDFAVTSAATVLHLGGVSALRELFTSSTFWQHFPVLVVNEKGADIFGRPVPQNVLSKAQAALAAGDAGPGLRLVAAPDGKRYLMFIPIELRVHPSAAARAALVRDELIVRLAAAVAASLLFSLGLAWYLTRPVRHLQRATRALAAGSLDTRVQPSIGTRRDEIADLGRDFDHMATRLQALVTAQQRLLHDVSHELRSPLARLGVAVALARQQPEKLETALNRIERESARLDELVGELLTLSRMNAGVDMGPEAEVDLAALIGEVVSDANFEAAEGRAVTLECRGSPHLMGREELLRRALENVVRNALRFSPPGGEVSVVAGETGGEIVIQVCDRGPGMSEALIETVFEPFVRGAQSPTGARAGYGLGLAIAKHAVETHKGAIAAENRAEGGLCVTLRLPAGVPALPAPKSA
ncbi:sensor histidine kinase [Acidihalobacter prosperus]|uniref:histidine kinase n=1 Tax=Acidihalobacter prosperus TaxID=160660 RepID=A0A1A6C4D7_9GAMM|nr:ATP-binding protein [Acidihalobacter prosperus]OBS09432.1 two-component sensor histidine kinase [Acidihalobacter prosperus]